MNEKSEQIDSRLNVILDRDQPLSPTKLDEAILSALPNGIARRTTVKMDGKERTFIDFSFRSERHAILAAAVTFLGGNGNHPVFKKRIQLKHWFKPVHVELSSQGYDVHFVGVYHYNANIVFVDFATATYMKRKMNNSSAFVYVNDLFRAMKDGVATRVDLHGNRISAIRRSTFSEYLSKTSEELSDSVLFDVFREFNRYMPFSRWIHGDSAIREMQDGKWPKWRETEWPGWYLEFKFATFLTIHQTKSIVYQGNESKKKGSLDFDLLFPLHKFYGDLKASDMAKRESPGNDKVNILSAIDRCDRFWYVIYEHETVKDKICGNAVARFRHGFLLRLDGTAKSPLSYASRMKNRVNFRRMMILELNRANCGELLSAFHQGCQPDGGARAEKVMISKRNVENYQVFHYEA